MANYGYRQHTLIMDIECYSNYFLVAFRDVNFPEKKLRFEMRGDMEKLDIQRLKKILRKATIITFNGMHYDMPMLLYALQGRVCSELKEASDTIIMQEMQGWQFQKQYECPTPAYVNHIDIFNIPKGKNSLKLYAARIGCKKLQDLPIDADEWLSDEDMDLIADYCDNDTANTLDLFLHKDVNPKVELRINISEEYGIDVRSKSDAQIGETLFKRSIEEKSGTRLTKPDLSKVKLRFKYDVPDFIYFETPALVELLNAIRNSVFKAIPNKAIPIPDEILKMTPITIGQSSYTIGVGGLHSNEKAQAIVAQDGWFIRDNDVGSYYPSIIINEQYYPSNLGMVFLNVFKDFRDTRLAMKDFLSHCKKHGIESAMEIYGNQSWADLPNDKKQTIIETYKIVLNGSFGKLNSPFSFLYSPKMLLQVTITGQLSLLMLIERIEKAGMRVVSANTDGIVVYAKNEKEAELDRIISIWEVETGYGMEYTYYKALYSQSVNSYLAIKSDGGFKRKGGFAKRSTDETGNNQVCVDAVMKYLQDGTPLRKSIESCTDFLSFCNIQRVTGGAYKDGRFLGKVIRWYYSTSTNTPILNSKGGTVSLTKGALDAMDLPDVMPTDIDYDWYVREAENMLSELGVLDYDRDAAASGLQIGKKPVWGLRDGQKTWHLIDLSNKNALCGAALKDRHDDWLYYGDKGFPDGRICSKCKKEVL